jgi:hypothetical protein
MLPEKSKTLKGIKWPALAATSGVVAVTTSGVEFDNDAQKAARSAGDNSQTVPMTR